MTQRILILTAGSQGDVQPYVALGTGLQRAGYAVTVATEAHFQDLVTRHPLEFAPLQAPFAQLAQTDAGKAAIAGKRSISLTQIMPLLRQMLESAWAIAQAVQPEVILYHPKPLAGYHLAEKLGIPGFLTMALPIYSPTRTFFNPVFGGGDRGGWLNHLSYTLFFQATMLPYRGLINTWRRDCLHLPPYQSDLVRQGHPIAKLYGYSAQVVPVPSDWDASSVVTGYWWLDAPHDWQPPADLVAFLAQGTAPVYIGFGSMVTTEAARITELILAAVQQSGQRAILATGWGGLSPSRVPPQVYVLKSAPHDWLFPRCAAVVHHGGAGTTGAGLRAGKPTLICPFIGDQPFWGRRVWELGVGLRPIPFRQLTRDRLAHALQTLTTDADLHHRAAALGRQLGTEDGIATAIAAIRSAIA